MKRRFFLAGATFCLCAAWVIGQTPMDDIRRMSGAWSALIVETGGKESTPEERTRLNMRLVVRPDGGYTLFFGPEQVATGVIRLNPSTRPASIDVIPNDGPFKGKAQPGIYAFQGDDMWTVFNEPGQPRPIGFKTRSGTQESMIFYRRVK